MDSPRWERIQALFHEAADLPGPEQRALLESKCGDDSGLMADVLALLDEDSRGAPLLDRGVAHAAYQVLAEPLPPPLAFQELGPYRIKEVLGEGGMGVVYLAERAELGSLVAIKILRDAWLSPARRERFSSEQRVLAQLNHPSIARLYDADTLPDGTPCFVMEYVEGVPLTEYCRNHRCSIEERLQLFRHVCEAVQYAHRHAVIHRDLKPSNILVKRDGTVRLLDFGIAKQLDSPDGPPDGPIDQTRTALRLMTPAYAAPEQIRGDRVGIHTDVYSLGVILYELLAGQLPFDLLNRTPAEAEAMIVGLEPEKVSSVTRRTAAQAGSPYLPAASKSSWADLDVLCLTAMHKDAQRRYPSVEALIRDLDHYLKGEPLEARPDSAGYRLGKFVRRNRRSVSAAAAVFIVVVSLVVFYTVRLAAARNAALAEAARTQRVQAFMLNLFQGGDETAGPPDSLRVVTLLDRGVQEARSLDGEPEVQAELYQTLGGVYQNLGKFDRADSLMRSALDRRRQLHGPDNREVADSLVALGLLRADQAKFDEAERLLRDGLAMSKRNLPANHPAVAKATAALGKVLEDRGAYDQAIPVLNEAVQLQSIPGALPTSDLASSLSELANANFYLGQYAASDSLNRRVLEMDRQLHGDRHPVVADTLINLGQNQFQWGHYREAERYYRSALDINQSWYGKDHPETADTMTILAQALSFQGRYDEAASLLQQSLAILEHVYGPVHPRVAYALNELGLTELKQGKLDEAEARFRRVLAIYRAVYGEHHYLIGVAFSNLAGVYLARKQYARAEPLCRQAVAHATESLSANHLNTGIARIKLGRALLGERRYLEAEAESRAGYEILMKQTSPSVNWLESARGDLAAEYDALKQPEKAAQFRVEFAKANGEFPTATARK